MKFKTTVFITGLWLMALIYLLIQMFFGGVTHTAAMGNWLGWGFCVFSSYCIAVGWDILTS